MDLVDKHGGVAVLNQMDALELQCLFAPTTNFRRAKSVKKGAPRRFTMSTDTAAATATISAPVPVEKREYQLHLHAVICSFFS